MPRMVLCTFGLVLATLFLVSPRIAEAGGKVGDKASEFPPGAFTDKNYYTLSDYRGKVVVLFFFKPSAMGGKNGVIERNKIVMAMKDKPVKFIGVAGANMAETMAFATETRLAMPIFADTMGLMQKRYGQTVSATNPTQVRVIGPDGKIVSHRMDPMALEPEVEKAKFKFKASGQDTKLATAIDLLEWNNYEAGLKLLRPKITGKGPTAEQGKAIYEKVLAEGKEWADEADKVRESDPAKAYDLYTRILACFPTEPIGVAAKSQLTTLKSNQMVIDELAARQLFAKVHIAFTKATMAQENELIEFNREIAKAYEKTPTGIKARAMVNELEEE